MHYAKKYTPVVAASDVEVLDYIAKHLAVSLSDLAQRFESSATEMREKVAPLVSLSFVKEQPSSSDALYLITAEGVKQLEKTVKRGLAAYL